MNEAVLNFVAYCAVTGVHPMAKTKRGMAKRHTLHDGNPNVA